ncbi:hypothetical protein D8M04_06225 [Oceanobacillus piezotolerans]|uniref:Uncharacterized protein n=1 Tax=Oceanobacillus piezotolerans TaxID=2448030 RepID=A0A498DAS2_9BACI|nr:hypothetical protein [Oceanobacillus piezotolerans]RLL46794.1 hypothetical protein D8M04_06225 [Oceanobacillus piezotolerans]
MEPVFLSIEEFNELMKQWNGRKIKITKHELDDFDETLMNLSAISYSKEATRSDDYVSLYSMQLNGSGVIETTLNEYQPLPSQLYEIPLEDSALYEFDGSRFIVSTSRGVYTIELLV